MPHVVAAVRPTVAADNAAIGDVVRAAFGGDAEPRLVDELRADGHVRIELVAVEGDGVVGHVLASELPIGDHAGVALAPLAVAPDRQRRGIGGQLVRALLDAAEAAGWPAVVVLGDPAYYRRFGFRPARELGITGPYGDGDAFQALTLGAASPPAGAARYPEPFGRL